MRPAVSGGDFCVCVVIVVDVTSARRRLLPCWRFALHVSAPAHEHTRSTPGLIRYRSFPPRSPRSTRPALQRSSASRRPLSPLPPFIPALLAHVDTGHSAPRARAGR